MLNKLLANLRGEYKEMTTSKRRETSRRKELYQNELMYSLGTSRILTLFNHFSNNKCLNHSQVFVDIISKVTNIIIRLTQEDVINWIGHSRESP